MASHKHKSDQSNANKGSSGTSNTYQKVLDNRSQQLNPNNSRYQDKNKEH